MIIDLHARRRDDQSFKPMLSVLRGLPAGIRGGEGREERRVVEWMDHRTSCGRQGLVNDW